MKQMMRHWAALTVAAVLMAGSAALASGGSGSGGSGGGSGSGGSGQAAQQCVVLGVTTSPTSFVNPTATDTVTVISTVTNCSTQNENVLVYYHFSGNFASCMQNLTPYQVTLTLKPGETQGITFTRPAPVCAGTYFAVGNVVDAATFAPLAQTWSAFTVSY